MAKDALHKRGDGEEACYFADQNAVQIRALSALAKDGDLAGLQKKGFALDTARRMVLDHCTDETKKAVAIATISPNDVPI